MLLRQNYRMQPAHQSKGQADWERGCHDAITSDVIWKLDAYRAALFLQHIAAPDYPALDLARPRGNSSPQISDAVESISSNIGEGYSRMSPTDRRRFYNYALGSTRECISRYNGALDLLPRELVHERLQLLTRIRSLLLGLIRATYDEPNDAGPFQSRRASLPSRTQRRKKRS
jgi:four helix bundle protein